MAARRAGASRGFAAVACARSRSTRTRRRSPQRAIDLGADIVNDISALTYDPSLAGRRRARRRAGHPDAQPRPSADMYARASTTTWRPKSRRELPRAIAAARDAGIAADRIILDPGLGFAKRAEHSFAAARRAASHRRARPSDPLGSLAQVVSQESARRSRRLATASGARPPPSPPRCSSARTSSACMTSGRWWTSCVPRTRSCSGKAEGRGQRAKGRGRGKRAQRLSLLPFALLLDPFALCLCLCPLIRCARQMRQLSALFHRPTMTVVGCRRHPDRLAPDLRGAEAHPRHARDADGHRIGGGHPAALRVAGVSAADRRLADSQRARLHRDCRHRALSVRHPSRAVAPWAGAVLPVLLLRASERAAETIEEVITASALLAKAKVGAIIVFEREIGLRNYVESGIPIDSTCQLRPAHDHLSAGTPLHDGAVIISEDADCRRGVLSAARRQPEARPRPRHAPPSGDRPDRRVRRDRRRGVRGAGRDLACAARPDLAPAVGRGASRQAAGAHSPAAAQPRSGRQQRRRGRLMAWHPFRNLGLKIAALVLGTLLWLTVSGHEIERRVRFRCRTATCPPRSR